MSPMHYLRPLAGFALVAALSSWSASAQESWQESREIKHVFVIALENHNWTQPATVPGAIAAHLSKPERSVH